ncbi:MAG: hypothetical protein Q8L71_12400 [Thiobacillus sp.]|nr:hypothetical protein [Thiobacillus sp.]
MQTWKLVGLPTTYLIDRKGHIAYHAIAVANSTIRRSNR